MKKYILKFQGIRSHEIMPFILLDHFQGDGGRVVKNFRDAIYKEFYKGTYTKISEEPNRQIGYQRN